MGLGFRAVRFRLRSLGFAFSCDPTGRASMGQVDLIRKGSEFKDPQFFPFFGHSVDIL